MLENELRPTVRGDGSIYLTCELMVSCISVVKKQINPVSELTGLNDKNLIPCRGNPPLPPATQQYIDGSGAHQASFLTYSVCCFLRVK